MYAASSSLGTVPMALVIAIGVLPAQSIVVCGCVVVYVCVCMCGITYKDSVMSGKM